MRGWGYLINHGCDKTEAQHPVEEFKEAAPGGVFSESSENLFKFINLILTYKKRFYVI